MLALHRGRGHTTDMKERLQFQQFTHQREQGQLALTLVGMSNMGKSLWAGRLAESGFTVYGCDDEIVQQLESELQAEGYAGGLTDVAHWMGQPHEPQFPARQARYLGLEHQSLGRALELKSDSNRVIDTTGSVVHLDADLLQTLHRQTTVVYLAATPSMQEEMYRQYLAHPKPVVWGNSYRPHDNESSAAALQRLYPELLAHRSHLYTRIAHATLTRDQLLHARTGEDFLDVVQHSLAK